MDSIFRSPDARQAVLDRQQAMLAHWPDSKAEFVVATRQGDTFVVTCGDSAAPPLVLLHGAGFNSASWTPDVATWTATHRVIAIDVIGEPGRSAESRPPFDTDSYAGWLDDVLDQLRISNTALVGASLGGWLAFDYAIRRPSRVTRLAALVPAGIGRQRLLPLLALGFAPFGRRGRQAATDFVLGPRPQQPDNSDLVKLHDTMREYLLLIQSSYRPRHNTLPIFTDDQLRSLSMPIFVIAGDKDRIIDANDTARRIEDLPPDATIELRPEVGHIPTEYTTAIARFLNEAQHS